MTPHDRSPTPIVWMTVEEVEAEVEAATLAALAAASVQDQRQSEGEPEDDCIDVEEVEGQKVPLPASPELVPKHGIGVDVTETTVPIRQLGI